MAQEIHPWRVKAGGLVMNSSLRTKVPGSVIELTDGRREPLRNGDYKVLKCSPSHKILLFTVLVIDIDICLIYDVCS